MPTNRELRTALEARTELVDEEYEGFSNGKEVLIPIPANDSADPLFYAPMGAEFGASSSQLSYLTGSMILLLGVGNLLFIPLAAAHGRRPALAIANSYGSLMGGRVLNGLGAALIETIGPMVIEDLFFLHQRGRANGVYFGVLFCATGFGPFIASVFAEYSTWRNFFWCSFATSMACQIALVFFPETKYHRTLTAAVQKDQSSDCPNKGNEAGYVAPATLLGKGRPPQSSFRLWFAKEKTDSYLWEFSTPLLLAQFPLALWPSLVFAVAAICTLFITLVQSILYTAPPYNFSIVAVGATNWTSVLANPIGAVLAGWMADKYVLWRTKRNNNLREPEFRLPMAIPFMLALILGVASLGISVSQHDPWAVPVIVSTGLASMGVTGTVSIVLAYSIDCYPRYAGQLLTLATIVKNVLAFGFSYGAVDWVMAWSWKRALGCWAGIVAAVCCMGVPVYIWGKQLRVISSRSRLMKEE
ncbi:hypothetical protein Rhopal_007254-T1 [Rhodotorula paludigena]|uniref:Major facilitator superfamily (MFS) profile domain-containing protein n=1 Tax=Rhodotorula paludigena TaxID=86838 RepID=A0AAV5GW52_9BASI|nr:hypothetical protein Rhopal_007254-T1 [Rhodotorula paludigena]